MYDPRASVVDMLHRAIDAEFDLSIDYFSRQRGEMNTRTVTPKSLHAETYLEAYCHARRDQRVFRLNRITRCVPAKGRIDDDAWAGQSPEKRADGQGPAQISLLDD